MWKEDPIPVQINIGRLADIHQAGAVLDMSERNIRRLIERGALVPVHIGSRLFVTRKSLMARAQGMPCGHE